MHASALLAAHAEAPHHMPIQYRGGNEHGISHCKYDVWDLAHFKYKGSTFKVRCSTVEARSLGSPCNAKPADHAKYGLHCDGTQQVNATVPPFYL